jgi:hypothetical protein
VVGGAVDQQRQLAAWWQGSRFETPVTKAFAVAEDRGNEDVTPATRPNLGMSPSVSVPFGLSTISQEEAKRNEESKKVMEAAAKADTKK